MGGYAFNDVIQSYNTNEGRIVVRRGKVSKSNNAILLTTKNYGILGTLISIHLIRSIKHKDEDLQQGGKTIVTTNNKVVVVVVVVERMNNELVVVNTNTTWMSDYYD